MKIVNCFTAILIISFACSSMGIGIKIKALKTLANIGGGLVKLFPVATPLIGIGKRSVDDSSVLAQERMAACRNLALCYPER